MAVVGRRLRGMTSNDGSAGDVEIDDRFLRDWIEFGFRQLSAYLAKHARFSRYCDEREKPGSAGQEPTRLR